MDVQEYQQLTGLTVSNARQNIVIAQIERTQRILESLLGYSLDPDDLENNEYVESGKMPSQDFCPCGAIDEDNLEAADDVVFAYRLFPYNSKDVYLAIDPATAIHAVKLVKGTVTYRTLDADNFRAQSKRGLIKYFEQCGCWCSCRPECTCVQLAVDADWAVPNEEFPMDLAMIWADMITFYADTKRGIKSESLGSHSYTRFDGEKPESLTENLAILKRYAGPNGSLAQNPTV